LFCVYRLATVVKLVMSLAIFFSYALQFYVPIDIINPYIQSRIAEHNYLKAEYALRLFLVLLTFGLAAAIPKLDLFISLVGSVSSSTLAMMAPSILDTVTRGDDCTRLRLTKNIVVFTIGFVGFITGTYVSVANIIESFVA